MHSKCHDYVLCFIGIVFISPPILYIFPLFMCQSKNCTKVKGKEGKEGCIQAVATGKRDRTQLC